MLLLALGCAVPEAAPRDLDALIHAMWSLYEDGTDDEILTAAGELDDWITDEQAKGTYSDITEEEAAIVEVEWDADPSEAIGIYVAGTIDCSFSDGELILSSDRQDELYEGNYTAYQREYVSSYDDFIAGDTDLLDWETTYATELPIAGAYETFVYAGMRRVGDGVILARTWMPNPAVATNDGLHFDQDYQVDVWLDRDGGIANLFATWRDFTLEGIDEEIVVNLALDGMAGFQDDTEKICVEGRI